MNLLFSMFYRTHGNPAYSGLLTTHTKAAAKYHLNGRKRSCFMGYFELINLLLDMVQS